MSASVSLTVATWEPCYPRESEWSAPSDIVLLAACQVAIQRHKRNHSADRPPRCDFIVGVCDFIVKLDSSPNVWARAKAPLWVSDARATLQGCRSRMVTGVII